MPFSRKLGVTKCFLRKSWTLSKGMAFLAGSVLSFLDNFHRGQTNWSIAYKRLWVPRKILHGSTKDVLEQLLSDSWNSNVIMWKWENKKSHTHDSPLHTKPVPSGSNGAISMDKEKATTAQLTE